MILLFIKFILSKAPCIWLHFCSNTIRDNINQDLLLYFQEAYWILFICSPFPSCNSWYLQKYICLSWWWRFPDWAFLLLRDIFPMQQPYILWPHFQEMIFRKLACRLKPEPDYGVSCKHPWFSLGMMRLSQKEPLCLHLLLLFRARPSLLYPFYALLILERF